jgi:surface antigen
MKYRFVPGILLLILGLHSAHAVNLSFLKNTPVAAFTDEDIAIAQDHIRDALNNGEDGEVVQWENPSSGAAGAYTLLKTYQRDDAKCRRVKVIHSAKGRRGESAHTLCQTSAETWRWAQ